MIDVSGSVVNYKEGEPMNNQLEADIMKHAENKLRVLTIDIYELCKIAGMDNKKAILLLTELFANAFITAAATGKCDKKHVDNLVELLGNNIIEENIKFQKFMKQQGIRD